MTQPFKLCGYLLAGLLISVALPAAADKDAETRDMNWVANYEIPGHDCKEPKLRQSNQNADQISRYQRKLKRYRKCVGEYQQILIADHQQIISIAQQSATPEQTTMVVEKLAEIQEAVVSMGEGQSLEVDPLEVERIGSVGNRPSI